MSDGTLVSPPTSGNSLRVNVTHQRAVGKHVNTSRQGRSDPPREGCGRGPAVVAFTVRSGVSVKAYSTTMEDTLVVRDGKIVAQSFAGKITPKG